jgi:predicted Rossmann fold nucleotide-binding protein DprA/Smf involved in DNA uptake
MFKFIIAGSRDFTDYSFLEKKCDFLLQNVTDEIEIISGGADGADRLGEAYAKARGYKLTVMKP